MAARTKSSWIHHVEKPADSPSITANVSAETATTPVTRPGTSSLRPCGSELSGRVHAAAASASSPKPTLNQKIPRQPARATRTPPSTGPAAVLRVDLPYQRQRPRLARGCTDAHHDPAGDERARGVGKGADERARAEEHDASEHDLLAAEEVAERPPDQHE